jgi:hypothetical protein
MKLKIQLIFILSIIILNKCNCKCTDSPKEYLTPTLLQALQQTTLKASSESTTFEPIVTATNIITTTNLPEMFIKCTLSFRKSPEYGGFDAESSPFFVRISDIYSINVYSGHTLHALVFNYFNGQIKVYGNPSNSDIKFHSKIILLNKQITAINIRMSSTLISSLQFLIFDRITQTYSWTSEIGENIGKRYTINYKTSSPISTSFSITSISGYFNSDSILSISVGYTSKKCNQLLPAQKQIIPRVPTESRVSNTDFQTLITTEIAQNYLNAFIIGNADIIE